MFVRRYWYSDSVADIARRCGVSENNVSVNLNRIRKRLRRYLCERGFEVMKKEELYETLGNMDERFINEAETVHMQKRRHCMDETGSLLQPACALQLYLA